MIASATEHINRQSGYWDGYEWSKKVNSSKLQQYTKTYSYGRWKYVLGHSTKDALAKFSKQYPKYTFKQTVAINVHKLLESINQK